MLARRVLSGSARRAENAMDEVIRISVRDLVEFVMRSGDLDERAAGASEEAMLEGARMHRKLQREEGPEYTAEVPLSIFYPIRLEDDGAAGGGSAVEATVLLEGRADGIFLGCDPENPILGEAWTVDEIKTTYRKLSRMKEPEPVHLAQAMCYAYIYAVQNRLDTVRVRMTYCSLVTQEIRRFTREFSDKEISDWFDGLMAEYARWAGMEIRWKRIRDKSLAELVFPFTYRPGQKDLAVHVYHTICHGRKLFLEAPTGTGKTISAVFPALKAMGEGKADRLFYFTAKTVTGLVALETFSIMREQGLRLRSIQLTAKDKICPMEKRACNPDACPRARGHFDRVNEALYALVTEQEDVSRRVLDEYAERHNVCPFELGLDVSLFADAVVGDYNYLFDPHARLKRFFAEGKGRNRYLFLVDEAHNLVERGREMYSASLSSGEIRVFRSAVRETYPPLWKKLGKLLSAFRPLKEQFGERDGGGSGGEQSFDMFRKKRGEEDVIFPDDIDALADAAYKVMEEMQSILYAQRRGEQGSGGHSAADQTAADHTTVDHSPGLRSSVADQSPGLRSTVQESFLTAYFELSHFLMIYEGMDEAYRVYAARKGREDCEIRLFCADPSAKLAECLEKGEASVLFSATLLPIQYYKRLLGGKEEDYEVYARSSFDPGKLGLFVAADVTSRYRLRSAEQYGKIAMCIHNTVSRRHGNYMAFFPSYSFMEAVLAQYGALYPEDEETAFAVQSPQMTEDERRAFLERFEQISDEKSLLGFCVLGGIFSEGIDLRQDRLIGALVVGTGFPQVCAEREILKRYFDEKGENGFDYAYRFPGMNKVLQAAGRVIRTADDVGVVVLMDERFMTGPYRRLFPVEWSGSKLTDSLEIGDKVSRFWDEWL